MTTVARESRGYGHGGLVGRESQTIKTIIPRRDNGTPAGIGPTTTPTITMTTCTPDPYEVCMESVNCLLCEHPPETVVIPNPLASEFGSEVTLEAGDYASM